MDVDIQTVIYSILVNDAGLVAAVTGIFDDVPQDQAMPYVSIGEDVLNEWDDSETDGIQASCTVHVLSRYEGRKEVKQIQQLIKNALHYSTASTANNSVIAIMYESSRSFVEPDGETRHGVSVFKVLIKEKT